MLFPYPKEFTKLLKKSSSSEILTLQKQKGFFYDLSKGLSMVNKVQKWFADVWDRMKTSIRVKPDTVFIWLGLILIIALGVLVRLSPIFLDGPLIKAFDPWIQFHCTEYLVENGVYEYFNWHSFMPQIFNCIIKHIIFNWKIPWYQKIFI